MRKSINRKSTVGFRCFGFVACIMAALPVAAVRPKTVYMVQHTHSDIGFARPQSEIISHYVEHIDHALDYCEMTADYPGDAQFRWTCETAGAVLNFLRTRPPEQVARLKRWIAKGNIEVTGMFLDMGEVCDDATLRHGLRELRLVHEQGIPVKTLMQDDVHGIPWCMADYAAEIGIRYTWMGENTDRALVPFDNPTIYRWQSPSGREMLAFRSEHYMLGNMWGIHNSDIGNFAAKLDAFLDRLDRAGYPFDAFAVPYSGFFIDDSAPNWQQCDFIRRWNESGRHKVRLVSATASMFMDHVARDAEALRKVKVHRAAYPDWWADGFGTSAMETGEAIKAQRELLAAEGVFAMSLLRGKPLSSSIAPLIADTRENLLYWGEHTMGSSASISDPLRWDSLEGWRSKAAFAWTAQRGARFAGEAAAAMMLPELAREADHATLTLFNSLPWTRDGFAEMFIDKGVIPDGSDFRFVDERGEALQVRPRREIPWGRGEGCYYRVFARSLPPCGYRTYRLEVGGAPRNGRAPAALENEFYRIAVDAQKGVVTSIFDKRRQRELVDPNAPQRLGEIIYETFPDRWKIHKLASYRPEDCKFTRRGCANFKPVRGESNEIYDSVKFTADFPEEGSSGFSVEIRLMRGRPAIELAYTLRRTKSGHPSSFYVAFPFNGKKLAFDVPGGLVHPGENQLEGTASAWNTVQSFAAAEDGDYRILLSSPTTPFVQFGKLFGEHKFDYIAKYDHTYIYAWPMNNYWWTNFVRDQNGDFKWSYTITTQSGQGEDAAFRWALAERVPLLWRIVPRGPANGKAREWRGMELTDAALVSAGVMPALDGRGLVMLVGERSGKKGRLSLKGADGRLLRFRRVDATERPLGDFCTELPVKPLENVIVYVEAGSHAAPSAAPDVPPRTPSSAALPTDTYRFVRFKPEVLKGNVFAPWHGVQISELELFEDGRNLRGEIVRAFADELVKTAEGRKYHATTVPAMAFDGNVETKWFDFRASTGQAPEVRAAAWVAAEFRRPVKITGYAWSTADDLSERDPSSWRLQGSNDGKTWTDIHVVRGFFATGMRNARAFAK